MSLVISRKKTESIMIGDNVEIHVIEIRGNTVRLSITAPKSVQVHRREVWDKIQQNEELATDPEAKP